MITGVPLPTFFGRLALYGPPLLPPRRPSERHLWLLMQVMEGRHELVRSYRHVIQDALLLLGAAPMVEREGEDPIDDLLVQADMASGKGGLPLGEAADRAWDEAWLWVGIAKEERHALGASWPLVRVPTGDGPAWQSIRPTDATLDRVSGLVAMRLARQEKAVLRSAHWRPRDYCMASLTPRGELLAARLGRGEQPPSSLRAVVEKPMRVARAAGQKSHATPPGRAGAAALT